MELEIQQSAENFRKYRFRFLTHIFNNSRNDNHQIDTLVESLKKSVHRKCSNQSCAVTYENLKRKCDACGSRVEKIDQNVIKSNISSMHDVTDTSKVITINNCEVTPKIKMFEPVLLNPNSYKNIKVILNEIKGNNNIGKDREWVFIGCDGPPYCLSERIAEGDPLSYDFASFVPGQGHMHMNQLKTIFKVLDDILLEPLGRDVLNFQSP